MCRPSWRECAAEKGGHKVRASLANHQARKMGTNLKMARQDPPSAWNQALGEGCVRFPDEAMPKAYRLSLSLWLACLRQVGRAKGPASSTEGIPIAVGHVVSLGFGSCLRVQSQSTGVGARCSRVAAPHTAVPRSCPMPRYLTRSTLRI